MRNRKIGKQIVMLLVSTLIFTALPVSSLQVGAVPVSGNDVVPEEEKDTILEQEQELAYTGTKGEFAYYVFNNADGRQSIMISDYLGNAAEVTIPDTIDDIPVTSIGGAFYDNTELISVIIPEGIKVPKKKLAAYKKLLKKSGIGSKVKVTK